MNNLRVGIIGLGKKGLLYDLDDKKRPVPQSHVFAFDMFDQTNLIAVCDTDPDKRQRFSEAFPDIPVYESANEMLNESCFDIISIATPVETHYELVRLVANYGNGRHRLKVIFIEKPIASSIQEAKNMIKSCEHHNIKLVVNHQRRWDPRWQTAFHNLSAIAPLRKIIGYCSGDPLEAGVHMADLFLWFGNGITTHYINMMHETPYEPYLLFELDIFGDNGRITISDNGRKTILYEVKDSSKYEGFKELAFKRTPEPAALLLPMLGAVKHIIDVAYGVVDPVCSGHDGLRALELALEWKSWSE